MAVADGFEAIILVRVTGVVEVAAVRKEGRRVIAPLAQVGRDTVVHERREGRMGIHPGIAEESRVQADDGFEFGDPGAAAHRIHAQQSIGCGQFASPEQGIVPVARESKRRSRIERRLGQDDHDVRLHSRARGRCAEVHVLEYRLAHFRRTRRLDVRFIPIDVAGRLRFEMVGVAKEGQCTHPVGQGRDAVQLPRRVVECGSGIQRIQSRHGKHGHDAYRGQAQPGFACSDPSAEIRHESSDDDQAGQ